MVKGTVLEIDDDVLKVYFKYSHYDCEKPIEISMMKQGLQCLYMKKEEWSKLIPEIKEWNHGKGINPDYWISCVGEIEHFIGFSTLFWPEFVLYRE